MKTHSIRTKLCNKVSLKVLDGFHVLSLLGLLGTAIWNLVLTVEGKATIQAMKPVFIASLVAALLKIPSQLCAMNSRGSVLTIIGSIVSIVITAILVGYLLFDPVYADAKTEPICATTQDGGQKYCLDLGSEKLRGKECSTCKYSESTSVIRGSSDPGHWSTMFH